MPDFDDRDSFRSKNSTPICTPDNALRAMMDSSTRMEEKRQRFRKEYPTYNSAYGGMRTFEDRFGAGGSTFDKTKDDC